MHSQKAWKSTNDWALTVLIPSHVRCRRITQWLSDGPACAKLGNLLAHRFLFVLLSLPVNVLVKNNLIWWKSPLRHRMFQPGRASDSADSFWHEINFSSLISEKWESILCALLDHILFCPVPSSLSLHLAKAWRNESYRFSRALPSHFIRLCVNGVCEPGSSSISLL